MAEPGLGHVGAAEPRFARRAQQQDDRLVVVRRQDVERRLDGVEVAVLFERRTVRVQQPADAVDERGAARGVERGADAAGRLERVDGRFGDLSVRGRIGAQALRGQGA